MSFNFILRRMLVFMLFAAPFHLTAQDEAVLDDVKAQGFRGDMQYYGFPFLFKGGYFYRYNDFEIFPALGISMDNADGEFTMSPLAGFSLQYKFFRWSPNVYYDLVPFAKSADKQSYYLKNSFSFDLGRGRLELISDAGKKRWQPADDTGVKAFASFAQTAALDFYLLDTGLFQATGQAQAALNYNIETRAANYRLQLALPMTFDFYYAELAMRYGFFYTKELDFGAGAPSYKIGLGYADFTGYMAVPFKSQKKRYQLINSFESELRWYFLRPFFKSSGFFLSAFGNVGAAAEDNKQKSQLVWQAGGGFGYNLFDVVPFVFHAGLNSDKQLIFYLGVVSKLSHKA